MVCCSYIMSNCHCLRRHPSSLFHHLLLKHRFSISSLFSVRTYSVSTSSDEHLFRVKRGDPIFRTVWLIVRSSCPVPNSQSHNLASRSASGNVVKLSFQLVIVISVIILADNLTYSTTFDVFVKQKRMFAFRTMLILMNSLQDANLRHSDIIVKIEPSIGNCNG